MPDSQIKEMMEAGVHFGHQTRRWNPKMKKFIFGPRNGIHILDLQKTIYHFEKAKKYVRKIGAGGVDILFIGTKEQAKDIITENAEKCGMPYVTERWLGGMLTNFETIKISIKRLQELETKAEDGTFLALSKKEVTKLTREKNKLLTNLGGIRNMKKVPGAVFVIDPKKEKIAISEAKKLGMTIIAMVDTNCDPDQIDCVIPANDDAVRSIRLILDGITAAYIDGKAEYTTRKETEAAERAQAEAEKKAAEKAAREAKEAMKEAARKAASAKNNPAPKTTDKDSAKKS